MNKRRSLMNYGLAVLAVMVALAARLLLRPIMGADAPFLLFFLAVMVSAWQGGLGPGLLAMILGDLVVDYFFMAPRYAVFSGTWQQNVPLAIFMVEGTGISLLAQRLHVAWRRACASNEELHGYRMRLEDMVEQRTGELRAANAQLNDEIVQHKQSAEELDRIGKRLTRSNKELEQFAYVASHDLQEPLRMVTGYLQLLQQRYKSKLDESADAYIAYAVDGASRMRQLIEDLLSYARIGASERRFADTDLNQVLREVDAVLQPAIDESHAAVTCDDLPTVRADSAQMRQLFQNLIGNAIKYHGPLPPRVHVSVKPAAADKWQFSISDNGIGIEPQYFERIFVIFQRLHDRESYSGTGIGLAVCRKIVDRYGGRIWVESTPGEGSTFHFTLPKEQTSVT